MSEVRCRAIVSSDPVDRLSVIVLSRSFARGAIQSGLERRAARIVHRPVAVTRLARAPR